MDIGDYEVVRHIATPECSLRVLRLRKGKSVRPHHHHKTTQIYFVLEGTAQATLDDQLVVLKPHQVLRVPPEAIHGIGTDGEAIVLSISIPPLDFTDQHVAVEHG